MAINSQLANNAFAITPSDTTRINASSVYVGGAGTVVIEPTARPGVSVTFTVPAGAIPKQLRLRVRVDDGCVIWINGSPVHRINVADGELAYNYLAPQNHEPLWEEVTLQNTDAYLFGGTNAPTLTGVSQEFLPASVRCSLTDMRVIGDECFLTYRVRRRG